MTKMFSGDLEFLSNFSAHPVWFETWRYPTGEHAYQAAKTRDPGIRSSFLDGPPGGAKRLGRRLELRPDWEQVKLQVMREILASKATMNPEIGRKLVATGSLPLVETNTWHDNIWGDCLCGRPECARTGQNLLGCSWMALRSYLAGWS